MKTRLVATLTLGLLSGAALAMGAMPSFESVDTNKDGTISHAEYEAAEHIGSGMHEGKHEGAHEGMHGHMSDGGDTGGVSSSTTGGSGSSAGSSGGAGGEYSK